MEILNVIRKRQNLKFRDLSDRTGFSIPYLSMVFAGKFTTVPASTQRRIAKALNVRREILFFDDHKERG